MTPVPAPSVKGRSGLLRCSQRVGGVEVCKLSAQSPTNCCKISLYNGEVASYDTVFQGHFGSGILFAQGVADARLGLCRCMALSHYCERHKMGSACRSRHTARHRLRLRGDLLLSFDATRMQLFFCYLSRPASAEHFVPLFELDTRCAAPVVVEVR